MYIALTGARRCAAAEASALVEVGLADRVWLAGATNRTGRSRRLVVVVNVAGDEVALVTVGVLGAIRSV